MSTSNANHLRPRRRELLSSGALLRLALVIVPACLLFVAGLRVTGDRQRVYFLGAGFQLLICALGLISGIFARQSFSSTVIILFGLGLAWVFIGKPPVDWYFHLAQAVLLIVPLLFLALQTLNESGGPALRHARLLARRLASRKDWPDELEQCRTLPEVKALREALYLDASPALELLGSPRAQVQIAALSALEFRKRWQRGQAESVLQLALRAKQPQVRATALCTLANAEDRYLIESLAEFLRDPAPEVRQAAVEALLWSTEERWGWIRHAVRRSLGDQSCKDDGPLRHHGPLLTPAAVEDLSAWATETGLVGIRAAATLASHYSQALQESPDRDLIEELTAHVMSTRSPTILRLEIARVLNDQGLLQNDDLTELVDPKEPAPLRLLAAERLLSHGHSHEALVALRDLARLPNREIAVATADVVQKQFHVELGLVAGEPLPALHSRQATEVSRRVMAWAEELELESKPEAALSGAGASLSASDT